jgi:hypothetical protein
MKLKIPRRIYYCPGGQYFGPIIRLTCQQIADGLIHPYEECQTCRKHPRRFVPADR